MARGPRDTASLVMLSGWDAAALQNFTLQDGTSYAQIVDEMTLALNALNAELNNHPLWSALVSYTDQPEVEYRIGSTNGFEVHTEYGRPDAQRAATEGHLLPLLAYDRMLGWTWDYLRKARLPQVQADIADAIQDARDRFRTSLLTRLLRRGDESGAARGLGTSGYSPGFATAAASTNVDFTPPSFAGVNFDSNHEHYVAISGGAFTVDVFRDAKDELMEHGHNPPFEAIIGPQDEATVRNLNGFVPAPSAAGVQYASTVTLANLTNQPDADGNYYIGVLEDCRIRVVRGMPRYYGFVWKSYGPNSQRNPLRIRLPKGERQLRVLAMTSPFAGNALYPLQELMLFLEFGVGVGDRTNGTPRYVNGASWTDGL
ncbi:MAG: hypothetical protein N2383_03375 [Caldilineales bacterium]|nr:hypothetical protein [Caldilineales bacterium]